MFIVGVQLATPAAEARGLPQELEEAAQEATVQGQLARAAGLLRGAWELTQDVRVLHQLGKTLAMDGQFEEAVEVYRRVLKHKPPRGIAQDAREEIQRLTNAPAPFKDQLPSKFRATGPARRAFKAGLRFARQKKLKQALRHVRAALVLDPELPGTYRVLGGLYGKLGDPKKEQAFLLEYLRVRPDGGIADTVRKRLKGTGLLTSVSLTSSFPCEIWVNGRPLGRMTPIKKLLLPAGSYTISFVNAKYHIIRNKRVTLTRGSNASVSFAFGVLDVKLTPWARVRAGGRDLGLWTTVGLPVGEYSLSLTAHDGSRKKRTRVLIEPGKIAEVKSW